MSFALFDIKNVQGMGNYRPIPGNHGIYSRYRKILIRRGFTLKKVL